MQHLEAKQQYYYFGFTIYIVSNHIVSFKVKNATVRHAYKVALCIFIAILSLDIRIYI